MLANFHGKQAIVFDTLLRKSIEDHEKLGQLIDQEEKFSLVVTDAYGKRLQIRRDLARFMGIDHEVKVQNIQNNLHLQDNRSIQPGAHKNNRASAIRRRRFTARCRHRLSIVLHSS